MITGDLIAKPKAVVRLHGLVRGDLVAEVESRVIISGMVQHSVIIRGGRVELSGMVLGGVRKESGEFKKLAGAIVKE
jgi:hypothetical protein